MQDSSPFELAVQLPSSFSLPVHLTLSSQIRPTTEPKLVAFTASEPATRTCYCITIIWRSERGVCLPKIYLWAPKIYSLNLYTQEKVLFFLNLVALCIHGLWHRPLHVHFHPKQHLYYANNIALASTCGNSTACVCYLNWKPVDPPPPQQTDRPVGKAGLKLQTL